MNKKTQDAFFALVRFGLFGHTETTESTEKVLWESVDWSEVYRLAEEQSVVGLVAAGIEELRAKNCGAVDVPQEWTLQFIGQTLQLEQRNKAMNEFVAKLITLLRKEDVYAILVKGQGIAQCYERPLWRASGDVDLLLSDANYDKAKKVLVPLASDVETEYKSLKHLGLTMNSGFEVELHGMMHSRLSGRVDKVIDEAQREVFYGGKVRSWVDGNVQVFLPEADEDVIFVFTHILKHFYIEGIGLRQICDWCRLLWTYRDAIDQRALELRLRKAGLMTEWKAFGALAIEYLGFPKDSMPLLDGLKVQEFNKFRRKADRIMEFVMETGNFGHNRMVQDSRFKVQGFFSRKVLGAWYKLRDFIRHARVFPIDSVKFFFHYALNGVAVAKDGFRAKSKEL